jgi:hypothetical protein
MKPLAGNLKNSFKKNGKRKALFKGSNSTCRQHIRQHYEVYKEWCEKAGLPPNHWAIPRRIWAVMETEKAAAKLGGQTKKEQQLLNFATVTGPMDFKRAETLNTVSKLITMNNQVSCYYYNTYYHPNLIQLLASSSCQ